MCTYQIGVGDSNREVKRVYGGSTLQSLSLQMERPTFVWLLQSALLLSFDLHDK